MGNNLRFYFVLLSVGAAIGLGNIWLYPFFSFKFTGFFIIPYLIALLVLGIPLLMLEFSIGQYFKKNVVDLFASVRKWFSSIGWLMIINAFIVMSYYAVMLSWHIIYIFVSFGLQWKDNYRSYFFDNVIQISDGINNFTSLSLPVFIALIIVWAVVFFYIRKGFESIKKYFLVTLSVFVVLMLFFLFYSLTLDNALVGIYSFLKPNLRGLLNIEVWVSAFTLAIISLGLSFGVMSAFARRSEKGFILENSSFVAIFDLLITIAVGFILFGILGFLSAKQEFGLNDLAFSDYGSLFTTITRALPFIYNPEILSFLLFLFLSLFFILGISALAYSISNVLVRKLNTSQFNASVIVVGGGFLFGLLFVIKPGFFILDIINHFIIYTIMITVLLATLAIGWFFNVDRIAYHIDKNSILKIGNIWKIFIRYVIPIIVFLLIIFQIKSDFLLNYNNYPFWAVLIFGVGAVVAPVVIAFLLPQKILDK